MELRIDATRVHDHIEVSFPATYLSGMELEKIQPEPSSQTSEEGSIVYRFAARETTQVKFYLIPQSVGKIKTQVRINKEPYSIHHFIYP
jgi:hypothetical protein